MSATSVHPLWRGSCRILMLSTAVLAAAACAVLAMGTQDARLLRLGLVAALWAALLGAFAAAKMRREARSCAEHAQQLQATYQLELEHEVRARREHTLTVERELREQAELSQRREIVELRAEIAGWIAAMALPAKSGNTAPAPRFSTGRPPPPTGTPDGWIQDTQSSQGQRTVGDLLAAHGSPPAFRRRRSHTNAE